MSGVSDNENKELAKEWINEINPTTVLDVGAGMGIYSILAKQPHQRWTALEVFYPYVAMFNLKSRYEDIIISDIRYVDYKKIGKFDLIILADMLEHMTKNEAKKVLKEALRNSTYTLICFPTIHQEQHAGHEGNDFETHIDHWSYDDMKKFLKSLKTCEITKTIKGKVLAYFLMETMK